MANSNKGNQVLTGDDIAAAFANESPCEYPPILSPRQLAELIGKSPSTIYFWIQQGRLDGAFRKRGKHLLLWRDKAIDLLFNAPDWK